MSDENMQEKDYKTEAACNIVDDKCLTHTTCEGARNEIKKVHSLRKKLLDAEGLQRENTKLREALEELDKICDAYTYQYQFASLKKIIKQALEAGDER